MNLAYQTYWVGYAMLMRSNKAETAVRGCRKSARVMCLCAHGASYANIGLLHIPPTLHMRMFLYVLHRNRNGHQARNIEANWPRPHARLHMKVRLVFVMSKLFFFAVIAQDT